MQLSWKWPASNRKLQSSRKLALNGCQSAVRAECAIKSLSSDEIGSLQRDNYNCKRARNNWARFKMWRSSNQLQQHESFTVMTHDSMLIISFGQTTRNDWLTGWFIIESTSRGNQNHGRLNWTLNGVVICKAAVEVSPEWEVGVSILLLAPLLCSVGGVAGVATPFSLLQTLSLSLFALWNC